LERKEAAFLSSLLFVGPYPSRPLPFSIYHFQIWFQIGPDARKNAKQADDVVQDLGTSRKPAAFDNADGSIWAVGEKGFLDHPKKFQEVACSSKASFGRL